MHYKEVGDKTKAPESFELQGFGCPVSASVFFVLVLRVFSISFFSSCEPFVSAVIPPKLGGRHQLRHRYRHIDQAGHFSNRKAFRFAREAQCASLVVILHPHPIAAPNLIGGDEIRHRLNEKTLDGALQVPCSVPQVRALIEQEILARSDTVNTNARSGEVLKILC